MNNLIVLIKKDLLEIVRSKKLLILVIVFLFVAIASPILAKLTPMLLKLLPTEGITINLPDPSFKDAADQFVKNASQLAMLAVIFLTAGAVSEEKNHRTLEILLTKPITRLNFILSKYLSYFLVMILVGICASAIFYAYSSSLFPNDSFLNFSLIAISTLVCILVMQSITILASTVSKSTITAGIIGFASYLLLGILSSLFKETAKFSPDYIFGNYQDLLSNGWSMSFTRPLLISLLVIAISIFASISLFSKQEVER